MTGETFKATIVAQHNDGTAIISDFGYVDLAGGSAHIDTGTAANAFKTLVETLWLGIMVSDVSIYRYRFACVKSSGGHKGEIGYVDNIGGAPGVQTSGSLPKELCLSFKRQTGHASKRDRGRIFFGPIPFTYWLGPTSNQDKCDVGDGPLVAALALLKTNLVVSGITLHPVILNSAGEYSGNVINQVSVPSEMVHRKSRRVRVGA